MKKTIIAGVLIVIAVLVVGMYITQQNTPPTNPPVYTSDQPAFDGRNISFTIENAPITLVNGLSEIHPASIPTATITTRYFGNEARGDLNFDGRNDVAFLVTQDGGGSGLFYYVVAALRTDTGYQTTNGFFIGDRIAPQTTEIQSQTGELRVNYAERKLDEPMTAQPSVGATKFLKVTPQGTLEGLMK